MNFNKLFKGSGLYLAIGGAVALVGIVLYLSGKNKDIKVVKEGGESLIPGSPMPAKSAPKSGVPTVITNFDKVWDYKLEKGMWYTKKKSETVWKPLKEVASNFELALQKLNAFITK